MRCTRTAAVIMLAALTVTGVTLGAAPAAAQTDDPALGDVFDDDTTTLEWLSAGFSGINGALDRSGYWVAQNTPGFVQDIVPAAEPPDAATEAAAVTSYYNGNNASIERWTNQRTNVSGNKTIRVQWTLAGETATRYVLVNASNDSIDDSRMVSSTNRTVGETVEVCGYAADRSPEELEHFVNEYAEPGADVTPAYLGRMKGAYGDDVETTLVRSDGDCPGGDS